MSPRYHDHVFPKQTDHPGDPKCSTGRRTCRPVSLKHHLDFIGTCALTHPSSLVGKATLPEVIPTPKKGVASLLSTEDLAPPVAVAQEVPVVEEAWYD